MPASNMMPIEVHFRPSGKWWIGEAPSLGVITQGETFERAQENLADALKEFMVSCLSRGVLDEVLREAGFSKVTVKAVRKAAESFLPLHAQNQSECRA